MKIRLNTLCTEYEDYKSLLRHKQPYLSLPFVLKGTDIKSNYEDVYLLYFCEHCGAELEGQWHIPNYEVKMDQWMSASEFEQALKEQNFEEFNQLIDRNSIFIRSGKYTRAQFDEAYDMIQRIQTTRKLVEKEFKTLAELKVCPCCRKALTRAPGYMAAGTAWRWDHLLNDKKHPFPGTALKGYAYYSKVADAMQDARLEKEKAQANDALQTKLSRYEATAPVEKLPIQPGVKTDPEKLKQYIGNLIQVETNVLFLTKRLGVLYEEKPDVARKANGSTAHLLVAANDRVETAKKTLQTCREQLYQRENANIIPPVLPMPAKPKKPTEPLYGVPGLFNKKKVLAENQQLKAQYEAAYDRYEEAMEEYRSALLVREQQLQQKLRQQEQQLELQRQEAREKLREAEGELTKAEEAVQQTAASMDQIATPEKALQQLRDDEIQKTEELLEKAIHCRHQLYDCGIIFMKYHNLVAISTFYEYLMSGRCTALEGTNGAYNIYEAEVRANTVIAQLSAVLESLEKIKENQFMIYQAIQSVNASLYRLEGTMTTMSKSLERIDAKAQTMTGYMERIAQNSDVIAHNTAVTAHYSRITAELTNALGYMVALG